MRLAGVLDLVVLLEPLLRQRERLLVAGLDPGIRLAAQGPLGPGDVALDVAAQVVAQEASAGAGSWWPCAGRRAGAGPAWPSRPAAASSPAPGSPGPAGRSRPPARAARRSARRGGPRGRPAARPSRFSMRCWASFSSWRAAQRRKGALSAPSTSHKVSAPSPTMTGSQDWVASAYRAELPSKM